MTSDSALKQPETQASKIEQIIVKSVNTETMRCIDRLNSTINSQTEQAIERINNVYTSAINTLKRLELTDTTIFDFFQKTNGNIRVHEIEVENPGKLKIELPNGQIISETNSIYIENNVKYKVILMAIRVEELKR